MRAWIRSALHGAVLVAGSILLGAEWTGAASTNWLELKRRTDRCIAGRLQGLPMPRQMADDYWRMKRMGAAAVPWLISRFDREHVRPARYEVEELLCGIMGWPIRSISAFPPGPRREAEMQRWRQWTRSGRLEWYVSRIRKNPDPVAAWRQAIVEVGNSGYRCDDLQSGRDVKRFTFHESDRPDRPEMAWGEVRKLVKRLRPIEPLLGVIADRRSYDWYSYEWWVRGEAMEYLAGLVPARLIPRIEKMLGKHYRAAVGLLAGIDDPRAYRLLVKSVFGQFTRLLGLKKQAEKWLDANPRYLSKGIRLVENPRVRVAEHNRISDQLRELDYSLNYRAIQHGEILAMMLRTGNRRWSDYLQRLVKFHGWGYMNSQGLDFFEVFREWNSVPGAYPLLKRLVLDADAWIAVRIRRMPGVWIGATVLYQGGDFGIETLGIHSPAGQIPALLEIWEKRLATHRKCHLGGKGCRLAPSFSSWQTSECRRAVDWNQLVLALAEAHPRSPILARHFMDVDRFSKDTTIQRAITHMQRKDVVDFLFRIATDPSRDALTRRDALVALRSGPGHRLLDASQERTLREMVFAERRVVKRDDRQVNREARLLWSEWAKARRSEETAIEVRRKKSGMDLLVELLLRGDSWHRHKGEGHLDAFTSARLGSRVMRWRRWWRDQRHEWGSGMSAYRRHLEAQRRKKGRDR